MTNITMRSNNVRMAAMIKTTTTTNNDDHDDDEDDHVASADGVLIGI